MYMISSTSLQIPQPIPVLAIQNSSHHYFFNRLLQLLLLPLRVHKIKKKSSSAICWHGSSKNQFWIFANFVFPFSRVGLLLLSCCPILSTTAVCTVYCWIDSLHLLTGVFIYPRTCWGYCGSPRQMECLTKDI